MATNAATSTVDSVTWTMTSAGSPPVKMNDPSSVWCSSTGLGSCAPTKAISCSNRSELSISMHSLWRNADGAPRVEDSVEASGAGFSRRRLLDRFVGRLTYAARPLRAS